MSTRSLVIVIVAFFLPLVGGAQAACPTFHNLANGTPADATQVMDNFNYILTCPNFSGNVGIDAASSALTPLYVSGTELPAFTGTTRGVISITGTYSSGYYIPIDFLYGDNEPPSARIAAYDDGSGSRLVFGTSNSYASGITNAALTIDSLGHVNIGTSTSSYSLYVNGTAAGTSAFTNLSDARLKKNIVPISDALAIVERLQGVRFEWREPQERTVGKEFNLAIGSPQVGFIAQALKPVLPEAVTTSTDRDAVMSVQESKVIPVLVEAVKELAAANRAQGAKIANLEQRLNHMDRRTAARITSSRDVRNPTRY